MKEYIEREAAINCLRKERAEIEIWEDDDKAFNLGVHQGYVFAINDVEAIPAADVRLVVYCKDCRHRDPEDGKCDAGAVERAGCIFPVGDNYFCSYGEKREES